MARLRLGEFEVWFDEADAQAPSNGIANSAPSIRVGVRPTVVGLVVGIRYRRADGVWRRLRLRPSEDTDEVGYFDGSFPQLRSGETVEYDVEVACSGTPFLSERRAGDRMTFIVAPPAHEPAPGALSGDRQPHMPGASQPGAATRLPPKSAGASVHDAPGSGFAARDGKAARGRDASATSKPMVVHGRVLQADGSAVPRLTVRAYDRDLRTEQALGEQTTDDTGSYSIPYGRAQFSREEKATADLLVRAFDKGDVVAASPTIFNAGMDETVDLIIGGARYVGASEYEVLVEDLGPVLQGRSAADLTEDDEHKDISFLAAETGHDPAHIAFLILATRIALSTKLPTEAFYGLFRGGLPTSLPALLAQSPEVQRHALDASLDANIVPANLRGQTDQILNRMQQLSVDEAIRPSSGSDEPRFGAILETAIADVAMQSAFMAKYVNHTGTTGEFWKAVRDDPELGQHADAVQLTLRFAALTGNHLPLVQRLQRMSQAQQITSLHDLARLDTDQWLAIIEGPDGVGAPPEVPGADDQDRYRNYADILANVVEDTFPTAFVTERLANGDDAANADLVTFLTGNPGFDLITSRLGDYVSNHGSALDGVADAASMTQRLASLQRVYRVVPRYRQTRALLDGGIHSARSVVVLGRSAFVRQYAATLGGPGPAMRAYERAAQTSSTALKLLVEHGSAFNRPPIAAVLAKPTTAIEDLPDWTTLFGSLDLCACEHCRSVYSPAAYLVDSLHFLKCRHAIPQGTSTQDVLFSRRPDLGEIELTCENTNTVMPYVDLVNEALEGCVAPPPPFTGFDLPAGLAADLDDATISPALRAAFAPPLGDAARVIVREPQSRWTIDESAFTYTIHRVGGMARVTARSLQTEGTPQELAANPRYLSTEAYDVLREQVFPWTLPFNLWSATVAVYFGHLGVARHELMQTLLGAGTTGDATPIAIAAERLGMTPNARRIVTGTPLIPPRQPWEFWGYPGNAPGTWLQDLAHLDRLLDASRLNYEAVTALIQTEFINPSKTLSIGSTDPDEPTTCDTAKLEIAGLDQPALDRFHRFERLRAKLRWSPAELDLAITTLRSDIADVNARVDDELIRKLAYLQATRDALHLSVDQALALWVDIPTVGPDSLYQRLFQNPSILKPVDPDFRLAGQELTIVTADPPNAKISTHASSILAALHISPNDLDALTVPIDPTLSAILPTEDLPALAAISAGDDALNLSNLSTLHRVCVLAKALRLSVPDAVRIMGLALLNPFASTQPDATLRLREIIDRVRSSGFGIAELDYLLRHRFLAASGVALTDDAIARALDEIRAGLRKIAADTAFTPGTTDPTGERTGKALAIVLPQDAVDQALSLLNGTWDDPSAEAAFIDANLAGFLDAADAKEQLVGATAAITVVEQRFLYVLARLLAHLRAAQSEQSVKQSMGERLGLESDAIEPLLGTWIRSSADATRPAITDFLSSGFVDSDPDIGPSAAGFPNQFATFTRIYKIATVIDRLALTTVQLRWLFDYGPTVGWYDLNSLPATPTGSTSAQFTAFTRLIDLARLRDALPFGERVLNDIFSMARDPAVTTDTLLAYVSEQTGWAMDSLSFLVSPQGLDLHLPGAFTDERALLQLRDCFTVLRRLGVSAAEATGWTGADLDAAAARSAVQAAKAKYDEAEWLTLAPALRDQLRELQRAALVDYLVAHPDPSRGQSWVDASDLYAHFLIDVEMSPCQLTSRIKQGISSAQLFVQRCLMNLETDVLANADLDENWLQWRWMKSYRVWEANRKIFLYPENWIEPDLRDDKTIFFQELDNEIQQADLTIEVAEDAFAHYLEKLDGVAWLDVIGEYQEQEYDDSGNKTVDILHVVGRTYTSPHAYHYRQRIDGARWTGWEPLDLDIVGDQIVPVVWNRRLHLFWLVFTEATRDAPVIMPEPNQPLTPPTRYWKIQLAWSEYKRGNWTPKRLSQSIAEHETIRWKKAADYDEYLTPLQPFTCKVLADPDGLSVRVLAYRPSLRYPWPIAEFRFDGCGGAPRVTTFEEGVGHGPPVVLATGTLMEGMQLVEEPKIHRQTAGTLVLFSGSFPTGAYGEPAFDNAKQDIITLTRTPGTFRLLGPAQDQQFGTLRPFFYADGRRAYVVTPRDVPLRPDEWSNGDALDPGALDLLLKPYYAELEPKPQRPGEPAPKLGGTRAFAPAVPHLAGYDHPTVLDARTGNAVATARLLDPTHGDPGELLLDPDVRPYLPTFRSIKHYRFEAFSHPYVCSFVREFNRNGVDGLMQRQIQMLCSDTFETEYGPYRRIVDRPYPTDEIDFTNGGAYSIYNWEIFFHAPLLIADRLRQNQQFEEAQRWFHYIFDPTDTVGETAPQRYWRTRPFFETADATYQAQQIQNLLRRLADGTPDPDLDAQVKDWRDHPFKPHAVARLRNTAYQKTAVMKYLDNLIQWGDQLFSRDTIESINEATQLYVLAADILGPKPKTVPPRAVAQVQTFNTLAPYLDDFSNALVQAESFVAPSVNTNIPGTDVPQINLPSLLYFCVPDNDKLSGYWDTVADRLFKIRHCMNITGVVRQLALFEPPIDPGLLIRAEAAGIDIGSVLDDVNAALPHHRFGVLIQKTTQLCADLKNLGAALLAALEKRDAEAMALLRSTHEISVLKAARTIRQRQIDEANSTLASLQKSRDTAILRRDHYSSLAFVNPAEIVQAALATASVTLTALQQGGETAAALLYAMPDTKIGSPTTVGSTFGGTNLGNAAKASSSVTELASTLLNAGSSMAGTLAGYQRRLEEWQLQEQVANKEIEQYDQQIIAAEIRVAMAERELENHELQMDNTAAADELMRDKYTNRELYEWTIGQIAGIYFQSYRLTYNLAQRAERAYRFELGLQTSDFIQFGYWDSLKKGLLAGERMQLDLQRMEVAYLDQQRREYELTRHVSLAQLDPEALLQLRQSGECFVSLPEALFDLDCPGHYLRRIQSVTLTIPCVTGPYTTVNCTLTQLKSSIRHTSAATRPYARQDDDPRFSDSGGASKSIVTSGAQADGGLFEVNARDERYLPFEGTGVISDWHIEMSNEFRQFDYDTISDFVMHLRYTAREGGAALKQQAISELREAVNAIARASGQHGLALLLSARHELSVEWPRFLNPTAAQGHQTLSIDLGHNRLPYLFAGQAVTFNKIEIFVKIREAFAETHNETTLKVSLAPGQDVTDQALPLVPWNGLLRAEWTGIGELGDWTLIAWLDSGVAPQRADPNALADLLLICHYVLA